MPILVEGTRYSDIGIFRRIGQRHLDCFNILPAKKNSIRAPN